MAVRVAPVLAEEYVRAGERRKVWQATAPGSDSHGTGNDTSVAPGWWATVLLGPAYSDDPDAGACYLPARPRLRPRHRRAVRVTETRPPAAPARTQPGAQALVDPAVSVRLQDRLDASAP
jgi:hypothetical protein